MSGIEDTTQLFSQAATLLMVGMGFVFAFLSLLIVVIRFFISPLAKGFPEPVEPPSNRPNSTGSDQSTAVVAAISAAVNQYRQKYK
jgi:oxaloacetate decarboxylase gamma subunit